MGNFVSKSIPCLKLETEDIFSHLEFIMHNQGLWHVRDQIFGYLDHETVEICRKVSAFWDRSLERISLVHYLNEFSDRKVFSSLEIQKLIKIIPGWNKAVKQYKSKASIEFALLLKGNLFLSNSAFKMSYDSLLSFILETK